MLILSALLLLLFATVGRAQDSVAIAVFEPHEGFIKASTSYGLSWDILQLAARQQGITLVPQPGAWDGAISRLKSNKVELIFGVLKTPERQSWLAFSYPLTAEGSMLYTLPSNPVTQLSQIDTDKVRVGAVDKSQHQQEAIKLGFSQIYPVHDSTNLYQMLTGGRLDYVVLGTTLARFYCQSESRDYGADCLKPVGQVLMYSNVHVAALRQSETGKQILKRLDRGIAAIYQSPDIPALFLRHGFSQEDYQQWQKSMQAVAAQK